DERDRVHAVQVASVGERAVRAVGLASAGLWSRADAPFRPCPPATAGRSLALRERPASTREETEMNTLQRGSIVVGVDEVALAGQAVRWAGEQAALEGRRILLVRAASAVTSGWSTH